MPPSRRSLAALLAFALIPLVGVGAIEVALPATAQAATSSAPLTFQEFTDNGLDGRSWNAYDLSVTAAGPTIYGTASAFTDPADGDLHVYVHGADGDLYQFVNNQSDSSGWNVTDLTAAEGGSSPLNGSPDAIYDPHDGLVHVYAQATNGDLVEYVDSGPPSQPWRDWDLTSSSPGAPIVSGTPAAVYDAADGFIHVYVRSVWGALTEYVDSDTGGVTWHAWNLSVAAAGGSAVAGAPSVVLDPVDGLIHVYVDSAASDLVEYVNSSSGGIPWHAWDLSDAALGGSAVSASPSALFDTHDQLVHVYVPSVTGYLEEYVNSGSGGVLWHAWNLTLAAAGGVPTGGSGSALYDAETGLIHIYERAYDDDLMEYVDSGSGGILWHAWDLTGAAAGPQVGGDPTGAMWGSGLHVFVGGPTPPQLVQSIVSLATSQDQYYAHVVETPLGSNCNPYTAYFGRGSTAGCAPGTASEEWCSDFADWVWTLAGIDTGGINGWAYTWIDWGFQHVGSLKLGATNDPEPGDAVVWGSIGASYAIHVGIVVGVSQGQIDVVSGNSGPPIDPEGDVAAVWESGYFDPAVSSISGYPIIGYVSPTDWTVFDANSARMPAPTPEQIATQDDNR